MAMLCCCFGDEAEDTQPLLRRDLDNGSSATNGRRQTELKPHSKTVSVNPSPTPARGHAAIVVTKPSADTRRRQLTDLLIVVCLDRGTDVAETIENLLLYFEGRANKQSLHVVKATEPVQMWAAELLSQTTKDFVEQLNGSRAYIERYERIFLSQSQRLSAEHWSVELASSLRVESQGEMQAIINSASADPVWDGAPPLLVLSLDGQTRACELLLKAGADINIQHADSKWTALHGAAMNGRVDVIDLLLRYGANSELKCAASQTPLELAADRNMTAAVALLKQHEEDLKIAKHFIWLCSHPDNTENGSHSLHDLHGVFRSPIVDIVKSYLPRVYGGTQNARPRANATPCQFAAEAIVRFVEELHDYVAAGDVGSVTRVLDEVQRGTRKQSDYSDCDCAECVGTSDIFEQARSHRALFLQVILDMAAQRDEDDDDDDRKSKSVSEGPTTSSPSLRATTKDIDSVKRDTSRFGTREFACGGTISKDVVIRVRNKTAKRALQKKNGNLNTDNDACGGTDAKGDIGVDAGHSRDDSIWNIMCMLDDMISNGTPEQALKASADKRRMVLNPYEEDESESDLNSDDLN